MTAFRSSSPRRFFASALSGLMLFAPFAQAQTEVYQYQKYMLGLPSEVPSGNASPAILDFGEVQIPGASPWYTVTFANTGNTDLSLGEITAPAEFQLQNGCGALLTAKQSCELLVRFVPSVGGVTSGMLSVSSNAYNSPDLVALAGLGTLPVATFSANPLNLGSVEVGTASNASQLSISNTGTGVLSVSNLAFGGAEHGFSVTEGSCSPLPKSLGNQESCALDVRVTPNATGLLSGLVNVTTNDASGSYSIPLQVTGIQADIALAPSVLTFGEIPTDVASAAQSITVTNGGTAPLRIVSVTRAGADVDEFASSNTCGEPVAPGGSCAISVIATPTLDGVKTADLEIVSNAPTSPTTASLSVTGVLPGVVTTDSNGTVLASVAFGNVPVDEATQASPSQTIVLKNPGVSELKDLVVSFGGPNSDQFSYSTTCGTSVLAGASCLINLTANPSTEGAKSAAVTIVAKADNSPVTIPVTASATVPTAAVSPTALNLASVKVGFTSSSTVTVSNSGAAPLKVTSVLLSGVDAADFSQTNTCSTQLAPNGGTCTVTVTGTPGTPGFRSATLVVASNDSESPANVPVSITGLMPTMSVDTSAGATSPVSAEYSMGSAVVGTSTAAIPFYVKNTSSVVLAGLQVGTAGALAADTTLANNCGASLPAGSSCMFSLTVDSTSTGVRSGVVTVGSDASNSPVSFNYSITGTQPALAFRAAGDTGSVTALAFSATRVGTASPTQTFLLKNTGTAPMAISSILLTGTDAAQFSRSQTCGPSLPAGATCSVDVAFKPTSTGTKSAAVTVTDDSPGSPHSLSLSGTGAVSTVATQNASNAGITTLAFGNVDVLVTSPNQELRVKNTGTLPLNVTNVALSGTQAADFQIASNGCSSPVAAGGYCSVMLNSKPTALGAKSATVTVTSDASNSANSLTLSATGTEAIVTFRKNDDSADYAGGGFGTVKVGTSSYTYPFLLKNTGNKALAISSVALTGTNPGDFSLSNGCGASLGAGLTCTLTVAGVPTSSGAKYASVTVASNDRSGADSIGFSVIGAEPALSFQNSAGSGISSANVGSAQVGTTQTAAVYLKNTGVVALNVYTVSIGGTNASEFQQTNNCTSAVAAGGTCVVTVAATPSNVGTNSATLTVTSDAPAYSHSLPLASTGIQATLAYRNSADTGGATSAAFGSILVGSTSGAQTFLVKNTGTATASSLALSLSGTNATNFAISSDTCGTTLAVGATCSVTLTATPSATGARTANLVTTSNATNPSMSLPLSVTGVQPNIVLRNTANTANITSLAFAAQLVGTTSASQQYRVYNNGTATATSVSVTEYGTNSNQFNTSNNCGTSLAAGAYCTVTVSYAPTVKSTSHTASAQFNSSAPNSPHAVALSGSSTQGTVTVTVDGVTNPTSVNFGTVVVN